MSVSPAQLEDYARVVLAHDAMEAVRELVQKRLFDRFRTGTPEQREVINGIMDNESLFYNELKIILGKAEEANEQTKDGDTESPNN